VNAKTRANAAVREKREAGHGHPAAQLYVILNQNFMNSFI
jgi:hypothetical protein